MRRKKAITKKIETVQRKLLPKTADVFDVNEKDTYKKTAESGKKICQKGKRRTKKNWKKTITSHSSHYAIAAEQAMYE